MKRNLLICTIAVLFLDIGCAARYLKSTSPVCQPLSAFDTIVISPVDSSKVFIEEDQYRGLAPNIAVATTEQLKDQIEDSQMFSRVIQSLDCADGAIKVESKMFSLSHHRGFHVGIRGQIVNCRTGERLYKFEYDDESDSEAIKIPRQIAEKLTRGIRAKLICVKP